MPTWLRKFTFKSMEEYYKKEKGDDEIDLANPNKNKVPIANKIKLPNYVSKTLPKK